MSHRYLHSFPTRRSSDLLSEASAANEQEFLEYAEVYKQRQQLQHELEKIPADVPESGMLFDVRADEEAKFETAQRELDRKSTRLNSSHTVISYAVFCLKK